MFIKLLEKRKILDAPGQRKIHLEHTPSLGGIPIFLGAAFALIIWFPNEASNIYKYFFGALAITFVIGLRDDLIPLRPIFKLLSQLIPTFMVIYLSDIQLISFYEIAPVELPLWFSWLITFFVIIVITNSINLIDGIDGLAGSVSTLALLSMGVWFFLIEQLYVSFILFSFVGGLVSFLIFNWQPSKIFMGDTGALLMGFLLSCTVIVFINSNYNLPEQSPYAFSSSIGTALCIMIIPLLDTLRVFVLRIVKSKSPFAADNNHMHHLLIKLGCSHSQAVIILLLVNAAFIGLALLLKNQPDYILLPAVVLLSLIVVSILGLLLSKTKTKEATVE